MGTTQPIRDKQEIEKLKNYFLGKNEIRNYTLVVVGINIPLRISDILSIKWEDIYDERHERFYSHLRLVEKKTGKRNLVAINNSAVQAFKMLKEEKAVNDYNSYVFASNRANNQPISRIAAYLIIHNAAEELGIENIGCHSLRKTFGYHAWKEGVHLALIMSIYNHSSINITKRYLGIEQEDKDNVFLNMNL